MSAFTRRASLALAAALACATAASGQPARAPVPAAAQTPADVRVVRSRYGFDETIVRLRADIAAKGIMFFSEIDQAALARGADVRIARSTLLTFGNPPLGTQFLSATPYAALDWPVRMIVFEDAGRVRVAFTDFLAIGRRHGIRDREAQLRMANTVAGSIADSVTR